MTKSVQLMGQLSSSFTHVDEEDVPELLFFIFL